MWELQEIERIEREIQGITNDIVAIWLFVATLVAMAVAMVAYDIINKKRMHTVFAALVVGLAICFVIGNCYQMHEIDMLKKEQFSLMGENDSTYGASAIKQKINVY